jgi:predicted AlkP superfamily phosphohydrolase/phosphomutase
VALRLMREKKWDLFWVVFTGTDRIQHYYWKFMDPEDPRYDPQAPEELRNAILLMYQRLDEAVGKILAAVDDHTTVLVISDHGFGPANREVMGDLIAREVDAQGPIDVYTTDNFGAKYALRFRHPPPYSAADSAAYFRVRDELVGRLRDLTDPATGRKVLSQVWLREELYHGPYVPEAPDVIGLESNGYLFLNWVKTPGDKVVLPADEHFFSGFHRLEGIMLATGPEVAAGRTVEGSELMDMTPTILALLQVPLPDNLDGKVLTGLFQTGWAEKHRPGTQPAVAVTRRVGGSGGDLARQLRAVGYLR